MQGAWTHRLAAACGLLALLLLGPSARGDETKKEPPSDYELMRMFVDTFEQIDRNYVKDVDRRELMEAAIRGMMEKLDPYSSYISPEELTQFNQSVEQEFGGIGIQVHLDSETKMLTVMTPLPGTPAYKAGVLAGDVIMEIEGKPTKGFTIEDAVKALKGKPGEPVTIGVRHAGSDKIEQIELVRDIIHVATVMGDRYRKDGDWEFMLDDEKKIGYIRLTHFSRRTAEELVEALEKLESQGMKALVLDLRFNPGGLLTQAVEIADLFIEDGKIVSTKGRNTEERVWEARKPGTYSGFPIAVLVNRFSASASEIVSAALQDHGRAVIVGERTWGKGSVQNVVELQNGSSALKLTTASYHRPSGKNIHKFPDAKESDEWGVMPDEGHKVEFSDEEIGEFLKYRRDRDVISGNGPPESAFTDRQLARALEALEQKLDGSGTVEAPGEKKKAAEAEKPVEASKESARRMELKLPKSAAA